jgi:hypothetical protein
MITKDGRGYSNIRPNLSTNCESYPDYYAFLFIGISAVILVKLLFSRLFEIPLRFSVKWPTAKCDIIWSLSHVR